MRLNYCIIQCGVLRGRVGDVQEQILLIVLLSTEYIKLKLKENKK